MNSTAGNDSIVKEIVISALAETACLRPSSIRNSA